MNTLIPSNKTNTLSRHTPRAHRCFHSAGWVDSHGKHTAVVKDYQGNIRATWKEGDYVVANPEESQRAKSMLYSNVTGYYPYGLPWSNMQASDRYLYSGKDLDRTNGLMLYDFHARLYDPQLGRFLQPDPCSSAYASHSPWLYCLANPIMYTDPSGMYITEYFEQAFRVVERNTKAKINELSTTKNQTTADSDNLSLTARIEQLSKSLSDITDMRNDPEREYRLQEIGIDEQSLTEALARLNEEGDQVIVMYAPDDYEIKIHEIRHGGQIARNEIIISKWGTVPCNYFIDLETDAYRAGFAYNGFISVFEVTSPGMIELLRNSDANASYMRKISNISDITNELMTQITTSPIPISTSSYTNLLRRIKERPKIQSK